MFGYIKPDKENLYVKELNLYKAVYCGLCETIKKKVSFFLPMTLSYDFVFLTMVRASLTKEKSTVKKGRCKYNILKKASYCIPIESALFSGRCALLLTTMKVKDDLKDSDTPLYKKAIYLPLYAYLDAKTKKLIKSCPEFKNISKAIEVTLSSMDLLEKEKCADIDKMSELFGGMMADMLSYSLEGRFQVIAKEIGNNIGKYIYLIDAIDDLSSDLKTKSYNPLIEKYGTVESMIKEKNALDVALSMYANNAILAFNLIEAHDYSSIINNILSLGFGKESYRIFTKIGDKK